MSIHTLFHVPIHTIKPVKMPPIVLCFGPLKPKQLPRFSMHDRRSGGDLDHVDLSLKTLNRIEHGDVNWIPKLKRRIENMAKRNLKNEVRALKEKGRVAEAKRRQAEGPKNPWHANTDAPLREGILTVNKLWFGGTGASEWDQTRVDAFRAYAMEFLKTHFPGSQLAYAASHSDEEAFHIHFVTAIWDMTTTANRGPQIQLRAAKSPILRSYEHAQDLAGEYFEAIGITRGERLAEARREAKEAGLPVPKKRRHISPSEYRAAERRKGRAEADIVIEKAVADCAALRLDAATDCVVALKKTRQRASRFERKARHTALRADAKLNRLHSEIAGATDVLEKTQTARDTAEAARNSASENARKILDDAQASASTTLQTARDQTAKEAAVRKAESNVQLKAAEEKQVAAEQAADAARKAEAEARIQEQRAQAKAFEFGLMATDASDEVKQAKMNRDAALNKLKNAQTLCDAATVGETPRRPRKQPHSKIVMRTWRTRPKQKVSSTRLSSPQSRPRIKQQRHIEPRMGWPLVSHVWLEISFATDRRRKPQAGGWSSQERRQSTRKSARP